MFYCQINNINDLFITPGTYDNGAKNNRYYHMRLPDFLRLIDREIKQTFNFMNKSNLIVFILSFILQ